MKKLRIGTDCSGIEAPIEALKQMRISFEHVWSCEIDPYARKSIEANYKPNILYEDIFKRNHNTLPDVDIYVCGFPCQPFSTMGNKLGMKDEKSNVLLECISVIKIKKPKVFILENVKGFKTIDNGKPFNYLLNEIKKTGFYNINIEILDTKDYGIPQRRQRLFIFGIRIDVQKKEYKTPEKTKIKNLSEFIVNDVITPVKISPSLKKNLELINYKEDYIITPFNFKSFGNKICPTLTTNCGNFYHTTYKRYLYTEECLLLQGFSKNFKQVVSNSQMYKQAGNSMSVNVLKVLFKEIFRIIKE